MEFHNLNFNNIRVLIVGDIMLDRYWHGGTSRISPEAPVPVVEVLRVDERPGGAANVAIGVKALGASPHLLGFMGVDDAALTLAKILMDNGISHDIESFAHLSTITKLRILSRNQQMIRLDMEKPFTIFDDSQLLLRFEAALKNTDVVILSDYGKGTLSHSELLISKARSKDIPVIVDPKSPDFSVYRGASVIKPNWKEFEAVVGPCSTEEIILEKSIQLLAQYQISALVITRSEQGVSIITRDGEMTHIPAIAREVHDVTGAGDTVISMLALGLGSGMDLVKAARLGNIAASIAVQKLGAATVSVAEIEHAISKEIPHQTGIMNEAELLKAIQISKAKGEKIVFTNGCFDILHAGHVMYLHEASQLGDRVIVAVNDNDSVSRLKGPTRPVNTLEDRMAVLAGLRSVDWVVSFSEDTPERIIESIAPDIMVKGGDYTDVAALPGARFVLEQGGEVKILGIKEGVSTTILIESIAQKDHSAVAV
jgi:D-beta-D-heptose 7-phosphate kinase/D-beta-D-heptose 1-phosphate adenosyltransferase